MIRVVVIEFGIYVIFGKMICIIKLIVGIKLNKIYVNIVFCLIFLCLEINKISVFNNIKLFIICVYKNNGFLK